ncbi:MAG: N-acetylmuramoyl-L-alanine amidase [Acidobacteriota bacterium]
MVRHLVAIPLAALVAMPVTAAPAQPLPARTLYVDATAQEEAVRRALTDPAVPASVLKAVRSAVASYEAIVRKYPASGYSDDALWHAGRLSLDAFERFGRPRERDAGLRLLRLLAAEYPTSKLTRQVPALLASAAQRSDAGSKRPTLTGSAAPAGGTAVAPAGGAGARPESAPPSSRPSQVERRSPAGSGQPGPAAGPNGPQAVPDRLVPRTALVTNIRRTPLPDGVRVTIEMDAEVASYHEERITGPSRIFVDLPLTRAASALADHTLRFDDGNLVRQVRIGSHPNSTTRVVLDATGVSRYSIYPLYNPYRLVIDSERAPAATIASFAAPAAVPAEPGVRHVTRQEAAKPPLASRAVRSGWPRTAPVSIAGGSAALDDAYLRALAGRDVNSVSSLRLPLSGPTATAALAQARASLGRASTPAAAPPPLVSTIRSAPSAPAPPAGFSMARQLGLGVSRIVIDPGHGGHDPGASGKGTTEAELVLDVSLRLQKLLEKERGVEVILTRRTDAFVPLQERTAIANREGADLFLSIHANASVNDQARGIETYFLNFANNLSAAAVAARENAASGQSMGALPDFVKAIALNNKLDESRQLATLVQQEMLGKLRALDEGVKDLGVKQAPFLVLIGASMPSVLAEISFLTNADDVKLLKSGPYRQGVAEALFAAIRTYQTSLAYAQTVAER